MCNRLSSPHAIVICGYEVLLRDGLFVPVDIATGEVACSDSGATGASPDIGEAARWCWAQRRREDRTPGPKRSS